MEMIPGPQILLTSNDVINETRNCEPAAVELPKDIFAFEMVSIAGNCTCISRLPPHYGDGMPVNLENDMLICRLLRIWPEELRGVDNPVISMKKLVLKEFSEHVEKAANGIIVPVKAKLTGSNANLVTLD